MSGQTQPETALQSLAEKLRTDAIAIFGEGQAERDIIEWFYGSLLAAAPAQPAERQEQHPDDAAVDRFAVAMKAKLAKSREKGRHGWQNASAAHLSSLLYRHVYKSDPLDVANLAMMLHQNGQAIELPHEARHEQGDEVRRLREALTMFVHLAECRLLELGTLSPEMDKCLNKGRCALAASTGQEVKP